MVAEAEDFVSAKVVDRRAQEAKVVELLVVIKALQLVQVLLIPVEVAEDLRVLHQGVLVQVDQEL
jgi:hypothetical protein